MNTDLYEGFISNGIEEEAAIKITAVAKGYCERIKEETKTLFNIINKEFPSEKQYSYDYESAVMMYIMREVTHIATDITKSRILQQ